MYIFKITFADGKTIASDTIRFPDSVKGVSILNNHLVITMQSGLTDDLGVINPYAETIVSNSETNTTEIKNNAVVDGNLQVNGNVLFGSSIISIQGTTKQNGILGTNADGKIAFKEISGGTQWYEHVINLNNGSMLRLITMRGDALKDGGWPVGSYPIFFMGISGPGYFSTDYSFPRLVKNASISIQIFYLNSTNEHKTYEFGENDIVSEEITAL